MPDNLGIENTTQSSALGLQAMLGQSGVLGNLAQAQQLGQQARTLQGQETPSLLQRLLSPGGLALLAGTGIAASQGGGTAAAGFGAGGLQGLQQRLLAENESKAAAVEDLQKQRNDALDRADKAMNRVSNLINTNPDLFTDPDTGEQTISPDLLGFLASGENLRLSVTARRKLNRKDVETDARHEMLTDALGKADSIEQARVIMNEVFRNQDWHNPDPAVVNALSNALGTPEFNPTLLNVIVKHGGLSGLEAITRAREMGVSEDDPQILGMIDWQERESSDLTPAALKDLKIMQLDAELTKWQQDPANRNALREIRKEAGTDQLAFLQKLANAVFAGRAGDINPYIDEYTHLAKDGSFTIYMKALAESGALTDVAEAVAGTDLIGDSPEERIRKRAEYTSKLFNAMQEQVRETNAFDDVKLRDTATARLVAEIPKMDVGRAGRVTAEILKDATDATGRVNEEQFEQLLRTAIEQHLAKEGQ